MAKVLLVEDDQNLREIFEMRLKAEGYETANAGDGEEALTLAVKEKPDLIIADVMMPKLSGFEMLEALRSSPDIADTKVIMMTALGQAEDQARGEKLGVIKYLVKSQVTLEDFVRVVRDVLPPDQKASQSATSSTSNKGSEQVMPEDSTTPTNPTPDPAASPAPDTNPISGMPDTPAAPASDDGQMSTAQEQASVNDQISGFTPAPAEPADPMAPESSAPTAPDTGSVPVSPPPTEDPAAPTGGDAPSAPPSEGSGGV